MHFVDSGEVLVFTSLRGLEATGFDLLGVLLKGVGIVMGGVGGVCPLMAYLCAITFLLLFFFFLSLYWVSS